MKRPLLLDTDVLVDFLRGREDAIAYVKLQADRIVLPAIVVAELYAGARGDEDLERLDAFLALFPVADVNKDVARMAGVFKRDHFKSHGTGLADAVIAATAQVLGADLKTFNVKHYPMLKGLKPPYIRK